MICDVRSLEPKTVVGARIKTTSKCCFYRKRRSFVNEQASVSDAKRIYKTSARSKATPCKTSPTAPTKKFKAGFFPAFDKM